MNLCDRNNTFSKWVLFLASYYQSNDAELSSSPRGYVYATIYFHSIYFAFTCPFHGASLVEQPDNWNIKVVNRKKIGLTIRSARGASFIIRNYFVLHAPWIWKFSSGSHFFPWQTAARNSVKKFSGPRSRKKSNRKINWRFIFSHIFHVLLWGSFAAIDIKSKTVSGC